MKRISGDFDVIVVGGGCAGLQAASCSRGEGASTLLVEQNEEIGSRIACAEGVGARGLRAIIEPSQEWIATTIDGAKLYTPDGNCFSVHQPGCGFILRKDGFLRALAEKAHKNGVEILTGAKVRFMGFEDEEVLLEISDGSQQERIRAHSVVAADGIKSEIARDAGILGNLAVDEVFSCAQDTIAGLKVDSNMVEFHFGSSIAPGGYAWVFPKDDKRANVGVGIIAGEKAMDCAASYLARFRVRRCPEGYIERPLVGGVPSVRNPFDGCGRGIFTAGDAARVADPISGAGIVPALESGQIAGRAAASYAKGRISLPTAEDLYRQELRRIYRDRNLRFAIRKVMKQMSDRDLSRLVANSAEFFARGNPLDADPIGVVKFLTRTMPEAFKVIRHLVGV